MKCILKDILDNCDGEVKSKQIFPEYRMHGQIYICEYHYYNSRKSALLRDVVYSSIPKRARNLLKKDCG